MKLKKIICWPPLLGGIGAGVTIGILAYITFVSFLAGTTYGFWLTASFASSAVVVFGYPDLSQSTFLIFEVSLTSDPATGYTSGYLRRSITKGQLRFILWHTKRYLKE